MECIVDVACNNNEQDKFYNEFIVRCKDCKFAYKIDDWMYDCIGYLAETWDCYNDCPKKNPVESNGYCAWGERRTNE